MKQQILDNLNVFITEAKGRPVGINDNFKDADLDSLGTVMVLVDLDHAYGRNSSDTELFETAGLTVREIVTRYIAVRKPQKCLSQ